MLQCANVLFVVLLVAKGPDPAPSIGELENAVLGTRRAIHSIHISFVSETTTVPAKARHDGARTITVWFDYPTDRERCDLVAAFGDTSGAPIRHIQGRNCERRGYLVDYWEKHPENATMVVELKPLSSSAKPGLTQLFDPRLLGMVPARSGGLHSYNLESLLGSPDRHDLKLRRERWQDRDCWVISFRTLAGVYVETWVVPSQGYSVVRTVAESRPRGKLYRAAVENQPQQVAGTGIWFPRSCTYESSYNGTRSVREVVRVTDVSLNQKLEDKIFTLAGMNIAPRTVIAGETRGGKQEVMTWTGEKLAPYVKPPLAFHPPAQPSRTWPVMMAVVLAVIAAGSLACYWLRRRRLI